MRVGVLIPAARKESVNERGARQCLRKPHV